MTFDLRGVYIVDGKASWYFVRDLIQFGGLLLVNPFAISFDKCHYECESLDYKVYTNSFVNLQIIFEDLSNYSPIARPCK